MMTPEECNRRLQRALEEPAGALYGDDEPTVPLTPDGVYVAMWHVNAYPSERAMMQ